MKLKKFSKILVVLCLILFIIDGAVINGFFDTKLIAGIGGGLIEKVVQIIPISF